ncbi:MAG: RND transporter, partial [Candidatus Rokuibacteriota bacterium]
MMRSARGWTAVGIVTAALLGGCAIGPNYTRPAVAEPQTFRGQAMAEAASLADAPWWEVFQDPILKTLIQEALRNNYDVRIAAARVQEARANFRVSRSDLYPSLDYSAGVARAKISPGITGVPGGPVANASNFYYGALTASWEVDIWGRIRRSNEAAWATFLATEDARRGVWLTLVSDLAQAYFELLELDVRLDIARNSTGAYQRTFNVFQDRFQFGTASRLETARAEGALGEAQATIPQLESDIVAKENQIGILLGKTPAPIP